MTTFAPAWKKKVGALHFGRAARSSSFPGPSLVLRTFEDPEGPPCSALRASARRPETRRKASIVDAMLIDVR